MAALVKYNKLQDQDPQGPEDLPAGLQEGSFFSSSSLRSSHSSPESSPSRTRRVAVMTSPPENPENPLPAVAGALET